MQNSTTINDSHTVLYELHVIKGITVLYKRITVLYGSCNTVVQLITTV